MREVFERLKAAELRINLEKTSAWKGEITY